MSSLKQDLIRERAINLAELVVNKQVTVREAAKEFGISKSTVHKDLVERVAQYNPSLAAQARNVLDIHLAERAARGGLATKAKYIRMRAHSN